MDQKYFTNPYNFVPLGEKCDRSPLAENNGESFTGYFTCRMELLTPLFVPNTSNSEALLWKAERSKGLDGNKKEEMGGNNGKQGREASDRKVGYEFCSYDDLSNLEKEQKMSFPPEEPVIPGSEIRGVIRSVYEAAFGGCMSTTVTDGALGRRWTMAKSPGLLHKKENGTWEITPCERAMLYVQGINNQKAETNHIKWGKPMPKGVYEKIGEGGKIWIKRSNKNYKYGMETKVIMDYKLAAPTGQADSADYVEGWLHMGERFVRKHHESVFYKSENDAQVKAVKAEEIELFRNLLVDYQKHKKDERYVEMNLDRAQIPVYYCKDSGLPSYMYPACMGKEIFTKTLGTILKNNGGFQACEETTSLCPACKVFGMVAKKTEKKGAIASRVRITDALLEHPLQADEANYLEPFATPPAGEPRPGAAEFYTLSPYRDEQEKGKKGEGYWTYDYYIAYNCDDKRKMLDKSLPKLRGRKFYWHNKKWRDYTNNKKMGKMQQSIRPLKASVLNGKEPKRTFQFKVYFEKLNKEELDRLRWSLDFCDKSCAHKLGRGKPFGFGSVKIHIDNVMRLNPNMETGQMQMKQMDIKDLGNNIEVGKDPIKTLKLMSSWENCFCDISYPKANGQKNRSYEWFKKNKQCGSKEIDIPCFSKILPKAIEECNRASKKRLEEL